MKKTIHLHRRSRQGKRLIILMLCIGLIPAVRAQNRLQQYIDSAKVNNQQVIRLQKQIQLLGLGRKAIRASYQAPRGYLSSDVNLSPYFNNHGQVFSTNPDPNAIGYDAAISNGGLYSALMNVDIPLFAGKATHQAIFQQNRHIEQLTTQLLTVELTLVRQVTTAYLNTLAAQITYKIQQQRVELLSREVKIMKQLTRKGMYRLVDYELMKNTLAGDSIKMRSLANAYQLQLMQLRFSCGINDSALVFLQETPVPMRRPAQNTSVFLLPYVNDSIQAVADNQVFNNRYLPQVTLYSNAGINAVELNGIQRKLGASAGIRLSYTLFDGKQRQVKNEQKMVRIDQARSLKKVERKHIEMQRAMLTKSISAARDNLQEQRKLNANYRRMMQLYQAEMQKGQLRVSTFLLALRNYNNLKLSFELQKIKLYKLINEYNYWNH